MSPGQNNKCLVPNLDTLTVSLHSSYDINLHSVMTVQEIADDIKKTFEIPNGHMSHSALQLLDDPLQI